MVAGALASEAGMARGVGGGGVKGCRAGRAGSGAMRNEEHEEHVCVQCVWMGGLNPVTPNPQRTITSKA